MDQFTRLRLLIGNENFSKIENSKVLVIGIGGVGSYVVEAMVRSGVKNIIIVDYDKIDITNLNRQLMTDLTNIGQYKTDVMKKRINLINDKCLVTTKKVFINESNIDLLFEDDIDYLIDCCDYLEAKKLIIKNCLAKKIDFITCLGTGNKLDPSKLEITTLDKTSYDPIARILRKYVKEEGIKEKITCCYSKEVPIKISGNVIASNSFVPSSAGLLITSHIIKKIIEK